MAIRRHHARGAWAPPSQGRLTVRCAAAGGKTGAERVAPLGVPLAARARAEALAQAEGAAVVAKRSKRACDAAVQAACPLDPEVFYTPCLTCGGSGATRVARSKGRHVTGTCAACLGAGFKLAVTTRLAPGPGDVSAD